MLKKAIVTALSFAVTLGLPMTETKVLAAEFVSEDSYIYEVSTEDELYAWEEICIENENPGDFYAGDALLEGDFIMEDAFSDGEDSFTDTENTSAEKTLEVREGEDITEKLNAALLEMKDTATDENMCKLIIPPGNYVVTNTICTYSNIHIYAVGAVITKVSPKKHTMLRLGNTEESAGGYEGYRNIIIEGGTWDCNFESVPDKSGDTGFVGFRIGHATNVEIKDVTFLNNFKSHLVEFGGVKNARITGCTFRGWYEGYTGGGQECVQIDSCKDYILPGYKPFDGTVCEDIIIEGNTFQNVFAGVGTHSMMFNKPYKNIVIRGNYFDNVMKRCVWALNYVDSVIADNVMTNVGAGVYVRSVYGKNTHFNEEQKATNAQNQYSSNLLVENNEVVMNEVKNMVEGDWYSFGISVYGEKCTGLESGVPDGTYIIKGVTVRKNRISGPGHGIRLTLADKCTITDNVVELTPSAVFANSAVIVAAGCSNTITGNQLKGARNKTVYFYKGSGRFNRSSKNNILTKNVIAGSDGDGIIMGKSSDGTVFEKNTIKDCTGDGIRIVDNSRLTVSANSVTGCKKNGIVVSGGNGVVITGNTVKSNALDGIRSEGKHANLMVKKNKVSENTGAGVCITGGKDAAVAENEIGSNKNNGISLVETTDAVLTKNTLKSNKNYAVIGTDSSVKTYSGNKLKDNDHTDTIYAINTSLPYSVKNTKNKKK